MEIKNELDKENIIKDEKYYYMPYFPIYVFIVVIFIMAVVYQRPLDILGGLYKIYRSPSALVTDYFKVGGVGASLCNAVINTSLTLLLLKKYKTIINGPYLAAIYTIVGFSFFGITLFNSLAIIFGTYLYTKFSKIDFNDYIITALFSTCLAPLISELAFNFRYNINLVFTILFAQIIGLFIGFIMPILSTKFKEFHMGFNIYNVGFTGGILGMILVGFFRLLKFKIETRFEIYDGQTDVLQIITLGLITVMMLFGFYLQGKKIFKFREIFIFSGKGKSDFIGTNGLGSTLINMSFLGLLCFYYVILVGSNLNGAVLGGLLTVMGNGAFSKHIKNVFPVMLGVYIVLYFNHYNLGLPGNILTVYFATTIAPIAGYYGFVAGFLGGIFHASLVSNIGYTHGGTNLYNNGFAGGFIAGVFVPILEAFKNLRMGNKENKI